MKTYTKYNRYAVRISNGMGERVRWAGVVGSLSFDVRGGGSYPIRAYSERQRKGGGGRCKNWTFFMDVINVWSLMVVVIRF